MNRVGFGMVMVMVLALAGGPVSAEPPAVAPKFFPDGPAPGPNAGPKPGLRFFPGESPATTPPTPAPLRTQLAVPFTPAARVSPSSAVPLPRATAEPTVESGVVRPDPTVRLPYPETKFAVGSGGVRLDRVNGGWVLVAGREVLHDFGPDRDTAEAAARVVRGFGATEWGRVGSPHTVVEYGLVDDAPPRWAVNPPVWLPIDAKSLAVEQVRGTWVVRDAANILLNVGPDRADADQVVAVVRRYGFNRLTMVGFPTPAMSVLYAGPVVIGDAGGGPAAALARDAQERALARTGLDVPGIGYVGERLVIDPRAVESRNVGGEWVLAHGPDVLARFGRGGELAARDAVRTVEAGRFTEFCRVGETTFFLADGSAPTRVPFGVRGRRFDPDGLRVIEHAGRWDAIDSGNRTAASAATRAGAEEVARVIGAYRFDTICQVGSGLRFYARTGR